MRKMVRRGTIQFIPVFHISQHQVVHICAALGSVLKAIGRGENIIVHQVGAMGDFHHQITDIICEQIAAHAGSLLLPIKPDCQRAVMNIVVMDLRIDRRMELNSCNLISEKFVLRSDPEDLISINLAEYAAQVSHNSVLPAVMDDIIAHDMGTDIVLSRVFSSSW